MSEKTIKQSFCLESEELGLTPYVLEKNREGVTIHEVREDSYVSKLHIDEDGNAAYTYSHGMGKGTVKLPHGSIYDIATLMQIINNHNKHVPPSRLYKEVGVELWPFHGDEDV